MLLYLPNHVKDLRVDASLSRTFITLSTRTSSPAPRRRTKPFDQSTIFLHPRICRDGTTKTRHQLHSTRRRIQSDSAPPPLLSNLDLTTRPLPPGSSPLPGQTLHSRTSSMSASAAIGRMRNFSDTYFGVVRTMSR